jgi:hypothetical protein
MMWVFHITLAAIFGILCHNVVSGGNTPDVIYLSYMSSVKTLVDTAPAQPFNILRQADDTPLGRIALPWGFDFFGERLHNVYVGPNGMIQSSPELPCGAFFGGGGCNFNTSYYGAIAGFLTDLDPSNTTAFNNISYVEETNRVTVTWKNIPLFFYYGRLNTFYISLYRDGKVELVWVDINPIEFNEVYYFQYVSGLRIQKDSNLAVFTSAQDVGRNSFQTTVDGVYPLKSDVVNNAQFNACPISTMWCASPYYLDMSDTAAEAIVTLTPLSLSCQDEITYSLYVESGSVNDFVDCSYSTGQDRLECDLYDSVTLRALSEGVVTAKLTWKSSQTGSDVTTFTFLPEVEDIDLYLYDTTLPTGANAGTCSLNDPDAVPICASRPCDLCNQNYTCLGLVCDNSSAPVLYKYETCNGTCATNLYFDDSDQCCDVSAVDCNGVCNGASEVGRLNNVDGALICCTAPNKVDCLGVCAGSAQVDACGVCNGGDTTGESCNTGVDIVPEGGIANSVFASVSALPDAPSVVQTFMNITNSNDTLVTVRLTEQQPFPSRGPDLEIPEETFTIDGNTTKTITFNVSFVGLLSGSQSGWETKEIVVQVTRPAISDTVLQYDISVFPEVTNCSAVSSRGTCIALPACLFCTQYPSIRVLQEVEGIEEHATEEGNTYKIMSTNSESFIEKYRRMLYTDIIPDQLGVRLKNTRNGYCIDGIDVNVCEYGAAGSIGRTSTVIALLTACISACLLALL